MSVTPCAGLGACVAVGAADSGSSIVQHLSWSSGRQDRVHSNGTCPLWPPALTETDGTESSKKDTAWILRNKKFLRVVSLCRWLLELSRLHHLPFSCPNWAARAFQIF